LEFIEDLVAQSNEDHHREVDPQHAGVLSLEGDWGRLLCHLWGEKFFLRASAMAEHPLIKGRIPPTGIPPIVLALRVPRDPSSRRLSEGEIRESKAKRCVTIVSLWNNSRVVTLIDDAE
jgi:hypothetical protein